MTPLCRPEHLEIQRGDSKDIWGENYFMVFDVGVTVYRAKNSVTQLQFADLRSYDKSGKNTFRLFDLKFCTYLHCWNEVFRKKNLRKTVL